MPAPEPLPGDLAELGLLVRATRPLPEPDAARRLDARAAKALRASATPRRRRRRRAWLMPALGLCACVLLVVVGVATSGGGGTGTTASSGGGSASGGSAASTSAGSTALRGSSTLPAVTPAGLVPPAGRAVERAASLRLGVRSGHVDDAAAGVARVAATLGGYVASSDSSEQGANLDLRVPSGSLDQAVQRLSQLGRVRGLDRSTLDITDQLTAARQRVQDALAQRRSLLRQLAAARSRHEAARIRAALAATTRSLEQARGDVRGLRTRASYSSIAVTVVPEHRRAGAAGGGGWTPGDALRDAVRILEVAAGVALVALAVFVPLGLVGVPAWVAAQRLTRRRREHALDLA